MTATPHLSTIANIPNIRDIADALPGIRPGQLVRSAKPSEASSEDVKILLQHLGIKELIDLRAGEELREDHNALLFSHTHFRRYLRSWSGKIYSMPNGSLGPQAIMSGHGDDIVRHQVSLLERSRYFASLLWKLPKRTTGSALLMNLYDKEKSRLILLKEVNEGGLELLYKILLDSAQPEICTAMNIILSAAENRRPLMFFCKAGKDRTGLIAALVLSCLGASEAEILADYTKSDAYHAVALAGIENQPELKGLDRSRFERAPPETMQATFDYVKASWGSLSAYLESIGFTTYQQARLKQLLTA